MKNTTPSKGTGPEESGRKSGAAQSAKIHPVVIYPFHQPADYSDLEELYQLIAQLNTETDKYARPITVMDRKTYYAMEGNKQFLDFRRDIVARHSDILDAWCVDTCQMWYSGLGAAFEKGATEDVYWLIPGDFDYGTPVGKEVLGRLHNLPKIAQELDQDLCIGEITTDHTHSKQLIDVYGTFTLLYNWFPSEAVKIRQHTERPRSEFLAIRHGFLSEMLRQRWYAYEQTVVMLLQAVFSNRHIRRFSVGDISDLPHGRESLASVMLQIERTERVLKTVWLERNQPKNGWAEQYRILEAQSEQVHRTALIVLQSVLV